MIDNEDYMDKVKYQIELNKLLSTIKPEHRLEAKLLYEKKNEIIKKNDLFADLKLKKINKKLKKLKMMENFKNE